MSIFFRDSNKISPTDGRKISKYILDYIKTDIKTQGKTSSIIINSDKTKQRIASMIDEITITKKQGPEYNELLITSFERSDPNRFNEILTSIKYKNEDEFKNLKLSDIIQKDRQKYFSDFLKNTILIYDTSVAKHISTSKNPLLKPDIYKPTHYL